MTGHNSLPLVTNINPLHLHQRSDSVVAGAAVVVAAPVAAWSRRSGVGMRSVGAGAGAGVGGGKKVAGNWCSGTPVR